MLTEKRGRPTIAPMTDFGAYIREQRKQRGLTQADLARETGLSSGAISMIETGERSELLATTARRLARALGVTADELIDRLEPVTV